MNGKIYWGLIDFLVAYGCIVWIICAWMFIEHYIRRFRRAHFGSLAVTKYVFGIVWHTTVVRMVTTTFIIALTAALYWTKPPPYSSLSLGYSLVRFFATVGILTTICIFSILDNPHIEHSNDNLEEEFEKEVLEAVKRVILK